MQDTVDQAHGAVPRTLADIIGVIGMSSRPTACRTISSIWVARLVLGDCSSPNTGNKKLAI